MSKTLIVLAGALSLSLVAGACGDDAATRATEEPAAASSAPGAKNPAAGAAIEPVATSDAVAPPTGSATGGTPMTVPAGATDLEADCITLFNAIVPIIEDIPAGQQPERGGPISPEFAATLSEAATAMTDLELSTDEVGELRDSIVDVFNKVADADTYTDELADEGDAVFDSTACDEVLGATSQTATAGTVTAQTLTAVPPPTTG